MRVMVIGLGAMGGAVAQRLIGAGFDTGVHDIDADAVARLVDGGGVACEPASAASRDVLLTSLPSDEAVVRTLLDSGLVARLGGRLLIELSTILPGTLARVSEAARDHDVAVVDSPVSGGPDEALSGTLTLLVGADDAALKRARTVLAALGRVEHVGPAGHGKAVKLVNNVMSMGNVAVAAEAFALGAKLGLEPRRLLDVLSRCGGRSHHLLKRMPHALERDFLARFSLALGEKDLRLALALAHDEDYPMPLASAVHQVYEIGRIKGLANEDIVAVLKVYEEWASAAS